MTKTPAKNVVGYLINIGINETKFIFRVYDENKKYIDYKIKLDDLKIEIKNNNVVLIQDENNNIITYSKSDHK